MLAVCQELTHLTLGKQWLPDANQFSCFQVNWYNISHLVYKLSITLHYLPGTYSLMGF